MLRHAAGTTRSRHSRNDMFTGKTAALVSFASVDSSRGRRNARCWGSLQIRKRAQTWFGTVPRLEGALAKLLVTKQIQVHHVLCRVAQFSQHLGRKGVHRKPDSDGLTLVHISSLRYVILTCQGLEINGDHHFEPIKLTVVAEKRRAQQD